MAKKKAEADVVRTRKVFGMLEIYTRMKRGKPVKGETIIKFTEATNQPTYKDE